MELKRRASMARVRQSYIAGRAHEHVRQCVREAVGDGQETDRMVSEATKAIERLVRS